jgi:hypothetical protein
MGQKRDRSNIGWVFPERFGVRMLSSEQLESACLWMTFAGVDP